MEKTKLRYEVPEAETLVVRTESSLLSMSDGFNKKNHTQYFIDDDYEEL